MSHVLKNVIFFYVQTWFYALFVENNEPIVY